MGSPRRFDHEAALARLNAGEQGAALAQEYGVTPQAIYRLLPGHEESEKEARDRYYSARRVPCEGGCGKLVLGPRVRLGVPRPDGRCLCIQCRQREKRESLRFDKRGNLVSVRCTSLNCANGDRWQTPDQFPKGDRFPDVREGGLHNQCRQCGNRSRREYRRNHPESRARENRKRMERYRRTKAAAS